MIDFEKFHEHLETEGIEFITGVPDSLLNGFCKYIETNLPKEKHVITANEGNAVGLAAGYHLATGSVPLVYMQNSGMGNAMNPLLSLTNKEVYSIPMILLIGWRGDPDVNDWAHHQKQGELTPELLEAMDIPYKTLENDEKEVFNSVTWAVDTVNNNNTPVALVVKKGVLSGTKNPSEYKQKRMSRENAIESVINNVPEDSLFVATTGRATREIYDLREINGQKHANDFLNVGAMGHASSIASGIALANDNKLVVCLDGDGSAIMHLGSLTTSGILNQSNFLHVVLNNGAHESVGGQETAANKINFTAIAENSGYNTLGRAVENKKDLKKAIKKLLEKNGPGFIDVRVCKGIRNDLLPNLSNVSLIDLKEKFMNNLEK